MSETLLIEAALGELIAKLCPNATAAGTLLIVGRVASPPDELKR